MRWRYWSVLVSLSVLLHMALFWPSRNRDVRAPLSPVFSVRIAQLQPSSESPQRLPDVPGAGVETTLVETTTAPQRPTPDNPPRSSVVGKAVKERAGTLSRESDPQEAPQVLPHRLKPSTPPESPELVVSAVRREPEDAKGVSLSRYRIALAAAAVRMQSLEAEVLGVAGTAVVDVRLAGGGPQVHLVTSSGVETLDRRALVLLGRAIREVPAPVGDGVSDAFVRLPVVFSKDES